MDLFKEVQENPLDIDAVVARRRKDFTGDFFQHLNMLADTHRSLEKQDGESLFFNYLLIISRFPQTSLLFLQYCEMLCAWKGLPYTSGFFNHSGSV